MTQPTVDSSTPYTPEPITVPPTCVEGWTTWMNIDTPYATRLSETMGAGDYEMIWELHQYYGQVKMFSKTITIFP